MNQYLERCYQLARLAGKNVKSNPQVGCVIVYKNRIIGEGYHKQYGAPHAEVNALENVSPEDRKYIQESEVYVSLEPCSHFGKTPPCSLRLIKEKVKTVHIGTKDSFEKVNGSGIEMLQNAGINVINHDDPKAKALIRPFLINTQLKRPYITLKFAKSKDHYIGKEDHQVWLSNPQSKVYAHRLRAHHDGILIGTHTAIIDDPSLTTRLYPGDHPKRLVIDKRLTIPERHKLLSDKHLTVIFNDLQSSIQDSKEYYKVKDQDYIQEIMNYCHQHQINRLLVEGGATTIQHFVDHHLWDEAHVIQTDKILNDGIKAPNIEGKYGENFNFGNDRIIVIQNDNITL